MFKGFLSGIFWGTMVGGLVLAVLSLYAPLPAAAPDDEANGANVETSAVQPEEVTEPEEEVEVAAKPVVADDADAEAISSAPQSENSPQVEPEAAPSEETVVTAAEDTAPSAPIAQSEDDTTAELAVAPIVDTEIAAISAPQLRDAPEIRLPRVGDTTVSSPDLPNAVKVVDRSGRDVAEGAVPNPVKEPSAVALNTAPAEPEFKTAQQTLIVPKIISADRTQAAKSAPLLSAPEISELAPEQVSDPQVIQVAAVAPPKKSRLPQIEPLETVSADTPLGVPNTPLLNPLEESGIKVVTGRLPTISRATPTPSVSDARLPQASDAGAIAAFASEFETNAQSLFSVIVIDAGDAGVPREQLLNSSYPITVAIDPTAPNAATLMQQYRTAGLEVVALINDLPLDATPGDVAVAVEGYLNVLDETVAIMDPLDGRLRDNSDLLKPVLGAIQDSGHGIITYSKGLNIAKQTADREGVPNAMVFRILDAEGEKSPKIKRYLKRAAFNAGRDGSVVVVGRSYGETMTALLEWALEQNDQSMAIAPLSAILQAQAAQRS